MATKTIAFSASQIFKVFAAFSKVSGVNNAYCPVWCADITIATVTGTVEDFAKFENSIYYNELR